MRLGFNTRVSFATGEAGRGLRAGMSPVHHGEPAAVLDAVRADPDPAEADELVLFLPPAFDPAGNLRLLTDARRLFEG